MGGGYIDGGYLGLSLLRVTPPMTKQLARVLSECLQCICVFSWTSSRNIIFYLVSICDARTSVHMTHMCPVSTHCLILPLTLRHFPHMERLPECVGLACDDLECLLELKFQLP